MALVGARAFRGVRLGLRSVAEQTSANTWSTKKRPPKLGGLGIYYSSLKFR